VFGDVVGISLRSPRIFRMRRRFGHRFERKSLNAEPRSVYLLRGLSRTEWQHSIPGVEALRYSITFRNVLNGAHHSGPDLDVAKTPAADACDSHHA
jgi:alkylated DNA repair dioxygenase AlkB